MPAASEAVGVSSGGGGGGGGGDEEQEFDICNDEGFVYKVPRGLYPHAAPSSTQAAAGPDPEAAGLRRRRRALLRLRAKRLRHLSRWEALASEHLAPLPAPQPPASQSPSASSHPVAAATPSLGSVLDDLLAQVDMQAELIKKAWQWCDEANAICHAHEAAIFDYIVELPVWSEPAELLASLCSPDENTAPENGCQEAAGVSSAAVERTMDPFLCHYEKTCHETTVGISHDVPPPIVTEGRKRKRASNPSGSNSVEAQDSIKSKRKVSGITSTPTRAADTFRSPGPVTRSRAAIQNV